MSDLIKRNIVFKDFKYKPLYKTATGRRQTIKLKVDKRKEIMRKFKR